MVHQKNPMILFIPLKIDLKKYTSVKKTTFFATMF